MLHFFDSDISIADYLIERLAQLGVTHIFGVPGDFNLTLLDHIEDHGKIKFVGCCNELNASHAADGYARVTQGLGALITTFGVGELSAMNGVAGCFSERVPMVHIVGVPTTAMQAHGAVLHHTMGDGRMHVFANCAAEVTIAQAFLTKTETAASEIDRVLRVAVKSCRPTYLTLPTDFVNAKISAAPLKEKLTLESVKNTLYAELSGDAAQAQAHAVRKIAELYEKASNPVILVDVCAVRYGVQDRVLKLINDTGVTFFTTPMAKGSIDEDHPQFAGVYVGDASVEAVRKPFEAADFIISVGLLQSDFNSGNFTFRLPKEYTVELHSDHVKVAYAEYRDVTFFTVLPALTQALAGARGAKSHTPVSKTGIFAAPTDGWKVAQNIEQAWFWAVMATALHPKDVVLAETGTSAFGVLDAHMPPRTTLLAQVLWGSIGWSVGAALGAAVAARNAGRRLVVFTGDGSVQVTAQELSSIVRLGLAPVIILLNNDGYTIERLINGPTRHYNDIQPWRWGAVLDTFGAARGSARIERVRTGAELAALLADPGFGDGKQLTLVEVIMGKLDAPRLLKVQAELTHKNNEA